MKSLLGPHCILPTSPALAWSQQASCVKTLDALEPFQAAPPQALRIFRHYFPAQDLADPNGAADAILRALRDYRHPNLYVELYNEVSAPVHEQIAFVARATERLHREGLRVAAFSFGTGGPEPEDWALLRAEGYGGADALALHEYWGAQGFSTWNALRYRRAHEWTEGDHPPFIITECGRDAVEGGAGGWKRDGIAAEQYIAELMQYAAELARDPYVLGACVFTAGPTPDWEAYGIDELIPDILQVQEAATMTQDEFERYVADIWARAGVPYNPDAALAKYWREQLRQGRYLGRPEEPEHLTENGQYVVQAFAGAILHCKVGEWIVREGLPPFV